MKCHHEEHVLQNRNASWAWYEVVIGVFETTCIMVVNAVKVPFCFVHVKGTIVPVFTPLRLKDKRCMLYFVELEKAFNNVPRIVFDQKMRKKTKPEGLVRSLMSLYE